MSLVVLLLGPTVMIYLGLHVMGSVPLTFALFYGWLAIVPLLDGANSERSGVAQKLSRYGLNIKTGSLRSGLSTGVLFFSIIFVGISLLQPYIFDIPDLQQLLRGWGFSGQYIPAMVLVLVLANPFLEEIYWRGLMVERLKGTGVAGYSTIITAAGYSLYHLLSMAPMFTWLFGILGAVLIFGGGVVWGVQRNQYDSLAGPILGHIIADIGIILLYFKFLN